MLDCSLDKHPLNVDFTWQAPAPPYATVTAAEAHAFHSLGGFALQQVFDAEDIGALVEELDALEAAANADLRRPDAQPTIARADEIVFAPHAVLRSDVARRMSRNATLVGVCRDLLGPDVRLYWDQLVYKRPHTNDEFPWHQDNGYNFVSPQQYLTCWVALTDATLDNGCPWIAPGIHRQGTLRHEWTPLGLNCMDEPPDATPIPLEAGSVAVFSSLTPHRTGPNLTRDTRKAYILQYAPDGAMVHPRNGTAFAANDPDRQYLVTG